MNHLGGKFVLILTTTHDKNEAKKLADIIVDAGAAACVSISSPVTSVFTWKGKVETEDEFMLFIKTAVKNYSLVEKLIQDNHSYEVPEIVSLPIENGETSYLQWMAENSRGTPSKKGPA